MQDESLKARITRFWHEHKTACCVAGGIAVGTLGFLCAKYMLDWRVAEIGSAIKNSNGKIRQITAESQKKAIEVIQNPVEMSENFGVSADTGASIISARTYTLPTEPFNVHMHIRNLPDGWHHSPEKALEAAELKIDLLPNQTLVDQYPKYAA